MRAYGAFAEWLGPLPHDRAMAATVHGTAIESWDVKLKAQQGGTMASLWHGDQLVAAARGDTPDEALQALKRLRDPSIVPLAAQVVRR